MANLVTLPSDQQAATGARLPRAGATRRAVTWAWRCAVAVGSALLLAAAYPPLERRALAWVALIPLALAVWRTEPRQAIRLGYLAGAVFWLCTLYWLTRVTVIGWALLSLYCALFFIPPAWFVARWRGETFAGRLGGMVGFTALWTACEYLRGTLFTGFPWNPLGVSQYANPILIQSAAWGGVWAVSALVAWVNAAGIATVQRYWDGPRDRRWRQPHPELMLAFLALIAAFLYGSHAVRSWPAPDRSVRVALIQPGIPQYAKWDDEFIAAIYERLASLSEAARQGVRPELLVWPETAVPADLRNDETAWNTVRAATGGVAPLLAGAIETETDEDGSVRYYNSALLVMPDGSVPETYDKQHLVLFGEYIPFSRTFPWLRRITPVAYDVEPGRRLALFRAVRPDAPFAVLICFEDVFPYLTRRFARAGAQWFVNQTNDAWYDFSSGSRQHLAQAVFRCVETRRPMARSANTGMTCWIDAAGRIGGGTGTTSGCLPNYTPDGRLVSGFLGANIPLTPAPAPLTFYVRHGDLFALTMLAVAALAFWSVCARPGERQNNPPSSSRVFSSAG